MGGEKWEEELRTGAWASGWAVSVVFLWTLAGQLLPFFVLCRTERFIPWVLSFAFISSTLAAVGAYFSIGYPGMVNLERLEQRLRRLLGGANLATHLPRGLISSLEAELGMLRIIVGGIVSLYVLGVLTILLSLDRIPSLLGQTDKDKTFAELPVSEKVWFICGMALLLIACHVLVAGPVHGQHSRIILWLRHTTTEEQKGPQ